MIRSSLFALLILFTSTQAYAQAVESEPLAPFKPYTMQGETDPMAMDPGAAAAPSLPNRPAAVEAPPPPGQDDHPTTMGAREERNLGEVAPAPVTTGSGTFQPSPDYPNNPVTGVVKQDESKFANRKFCTLKVYFGSIGTGVDVKTADRVKAYLDGNTDKLAYIRGEERGKEGEFSYCIDVKEHRDQGNIYTSLKKLLPPPSGTRAPTTISGKGFAPIKTSEER